MFGLPLSVPTWALKAAGIAALLVAVLLAVHTWDSAIRHGAVADTQLAQARAAVKVERKVAKITTASAVHEADAQAVEKEKTRVVIQKVRQYMVRTVPVACVPWSLVRLHDAAVRGDNPDAATAPAGQPDAACAPIDPGEFAAVIAENYGIARANAGQLNRLEADVRQRIDAANGTGDNHGSN